MLKRMTGLMSKASAPFLAQAAIGVAALLLSLVVGLTITAKLLLDARGDLGACQRGEGAAMEQAAANREVAVRLSDRLSTCVHAKAWDLQAQAEAQAAWEQSMAALRARLTDERDARRPLYETDDRCKAMRSCVVCAPMAERLRKSRAATGR